MKRVNLLDCSLRDGGYVNDWKFGKDNILWIFQKLQKAKIDIVELGYIRSWETYNPDRAVFTGTKDINTLFKGIEKKTLVSAMIDYGACDIDAIEEAKDSFIDILRVTFRQNNIDEAIDYCKKIKEKGYKVFLQPVSITSYSDIEMLNLIEKINELKPIALSIVDSYGLMHEEKVIRYFYLMDNNLLPEIAIAYHSHNNFQLAYSNSIKLLNMNCKREMYFDASLYGIGKTAGNCNIELLAMYMNKTCSKNYDLAEILNVIDVQILKLLKDYIWGYQLPYFISASNDCHPNYVNHLLEKNMITTKEINQIVSKISDDKRLIYDKEYIEKLYFEHQSKKVDDDFATSKLAEKFKEQKIVLIASGTSVSKKHNTIEKYIKDNNSLVVSLNHINKYIKTDYIYISNAKRFEQFEMLLGDKNRGFETIITSNIEDENKKANYVLDWVSLTSKETIVGTSSLYILLNFFKKIGVNEITLAGFDGFSKYAANYYDSNFNFYKEPENIDDVTKEIAKQLGYFQQYMRINFLTKSKYDKKGLYANV